MSTDKGFRESMLTSEAIREAVRKLQEAECRPPTQRYIEVLSVTPKIAERLKKLEEYEPLHMYIDKVEPLQGEIGRIRHDSTQHTRLVMGSW